MAAAVDVLIESLGPVTASGAAAPANGSPPATSGFDAAALRLEVIHLLVLLLQVPLDEVNHHVCPVQTSSNHPSTADVATSAPMCSIWHQTLG